MKNCTQCKYAEWKRTASGKLHPSGEGRCTYKIEIPQLPQAFYWIFRHAPEPSGGAIERKRELKDHCAYWSKP